MRDVSRQKPGITSPSHNEPLSLILGHDGAGRQERGPVLAVMQGQGVVSRSSKGDICFLPEFPAWTLPDACPRIPGPTKGMLLLLLFMPQKNSGQEKRQLVTEMQGRGGSILQM